ncbi:WD domain, G-beta repeat [Helicobacter mustelae]|uniref:WD40 repeat domain-containing protein n=1 Tax=Helicobacter mustelae TaxID=217 RepID=UPI000E00CA7A|nr:WD40 repeat domain-containing protein [Helicobacter mustelae]STP12792.1 WD domain, G-beta repeat [Helicobacter mustelae]
MLQEKYNLKLLHTVLSLAHNRDYLLFADSHYGVYLYSIPEKKVLFGKRVSRDTTKHHMYSKAIACSDQGYIFIANAGDRLCNLCRVSENGFKIKAKIQWHKARVNSVAFSQDSKLFAIGGEDGRVFLYTTSDAKFYAILPIQPEYISCMSFDSANHYFVFATFEKKILVFDLYSCTTLSEVDVPSVVESLVFFNHDKQILFVCKDGEVGVYDIFSNQTRNIKINYTWLNQCVLHRNEKYAYIAGRENKLLVYKIATNRIFLELTLPESGVSFMRLVGELLCICFISGRVIFLDSRYGYQEFEQLLLAKNYEEAKAFAEVNNVLLKLEDLYEKTRLENWSEVLKDILNLFINNEVDNALHVAEPYLEDPILEREFRYYFDEKEVILQFLQLIQKEKYTDVYAMANAKHGLRKLVLFAELERYFSSIFEACKNILEKDGVRGTVRVRKVLEPFMRVSEKREQIEFLLQNFLQYQNIQKAFKDNDYISCFALADKFIFLQKTKAYQKALQHCSNLLYHIKENMQSKKYEDLESEIAMLKRIPYFKDEAEGLIHFFLHQEEFKRDFDKQNYAACYELLERYPNLYACDAYFALEELVLNVLQKALDLAKHGNTSGVYHELEKFLTLEKWKRRIKTIFQIAYFYEIKYNNAQINPIDAHATLQQYIDFFGKTSEFRVLCEQKNLEQVFDEILERRTEMRYLETILVGAGHA